MRWNTLYIMYIYIQCIKCTNAWAANPWAEGRGHERLEACARRMWGLEEERTDRLAREQTRAAMVTVAFPPRHVTMDTLSALRLRANLAKALAPSLILSFFFLYNTHAHSLHHILSCVCLLLPFLLRRANEMCIQLSKEMLHSPISIFFFFFFHLLI